MQAGRELDLLVAEKVMSWTGPRCTFVGFGAMLRAPDGHYDVPPHYSRDIAAAWLVVGHLTSRYHWRISSPFDPKHADCRLWFAGLTPHSCTGWNGRPDLECGGQTAPEAICLVALKAVGALPLEGRDVDSTLAALEADRT